MKTRALDLLERVAWTAIQAALAVWIVSGDDLWALDSLKVAGTAAAIAAAKCLLAFNIGSGNTAATLPAGPDTDLGGDAGEAPLDLLAKVLVLVILVAVTLYVLRVLL